MIQSLLAVIGGFATRAVFVMVTTAAAASALAGADRSGRVVGAA